MVKPTQNSMVRVKLSPRFLFLSERAKIQVEEIYFPFGQTSWSYTNFKGISNTHEAD